MERQVAARYAEALFSLAGERDEVERIDGDLKTAAALFGEMPDMPRLLEHPEVAEERKFHLLERTFGDSILPATLSFLRLLVRRGRSQLLSLVEEEYRLLADAAAGIEKAEVTAARPLAAKQEERLRLALERLTGKEIEIEVRLEPELLAGLRVQIGHRLIDGSAAGRLEALHFKLKEAGRGG